MKDDQLSINLGSVGNAFTQGGNRLCFYHPLDPNICIKVPRPDRTPELRRKQKSFPKSLKPLSRFDENFLEWREVQTINRLIGREAFALIPYYYGMVNTNLGQGLSCEMIRDGDGKISLSLKQYLWEHGLDKIVKAALSQFSKRWVDLGMPSRDLLLHNMVLQQKSQEQPEARIVVVDGLGWSGLAAIGYYCKWAARRRAAKKITRLQEAITRLLSIKQQQGAWGYHGWLDEKQRLVDSHE